MIKLLNKLFNDYTWGQQHRLQLMQTVYFMFIFFSIPVAATVDL